MNRESNSSILVQSPTRYDPENKLLITSVDNKLNLIMPDSKPLAQLPVPVLTRSITVGTLFAAAHSVLDKQTCAIHKE